MKNKIIIAAVVLIVITAAVIYYSKKQEPAAAEETTSSFLLEKGEIIQTVSVTGTVEPNYTVEVRSKASGEIINFPYSEGDKVKRGDLLLELEPSNEQRNLTTARVNLDAANARLSRARSQLVITQSTLDKNKEYLNIEYRDLQHKKNDAESKYERSKELYKNNLLSREALETAELTYINVSSQFQKIAADSAAFPSEYEKIKISESDIKDAQIAVQKSRIALEDAEERRRETKIYSPLDGTIIRTAVTEGQIITSSISSVGEGTVLMTIADLSKLYITATIDESDIGKIKTAQDARISFDAFYNKRFRGKVERIAPKSQTVSNVTVFPVKIEITDENVSDLKVGMTANVTVMIAEKKDIFTVPIGAIRIGEGRPFVTVKRDGEEVKVNIKQGITDGINIELLGDFKEGDEIVMQGGSGSREDGRDARRRMRMF